MANEYNSSYTGIQIDTAVGKVLNDEVGGGKAVARFVVGTSTAGWTAKDCDYLCDGTADDVEINAAIQALPVDGGEIIVLDGIYQIGAQILVNKNNVSLRGNGVATKFVRGFNDTPIDGNGVIRLGNVSRCKVEGFYIDGNKSIYTSSDNNGIYLSSSANNNTITGNTCNNSSCCGINLKDSSYNIIIGNTCNDNSWYGIYLSSSNNNRITNNICNNNSFTGIQMTYSSDANIITSNICINNSQGIALNGSSNNTITGNTCNNNSNIGMELIYSSNENAITGNACNSNNYAGMELISCSYNTITGNTCIENNPYGIHLDNSNSKNTITSNTCTRSGYTSSQRTIYVEDNNNNYNNITDNNCMGKAPTIDGGTGNTVFNNKYDESDEFSSHLAEDASTTEKGHVKLENSTSSTSITTAAVPKNVKDAYDLAKDAQSPPIITLTANTTLALTYAGKVLDCTNASAITVTIPANTSVAFPVGTEIAILRSGAGDVTLETASGVTLNSDGSKKKIKAQYTSGALKKTGTDTWMLVGNLA